MRTNSVYSYRTTCSCFHPHWFFFFFRVCSGASCSSVQASWLFNLISSFLGCISPELGGDDPWVNQLSWFPLPSRALPHGILPSRFLKRPNSALLKSRVVILLCSLLTLGLWHTKVLGSIHAAKNQLWICITHHRKNACGQSVLVLPVEFHGCWCNVRESSKIFGA